jgi:hypothetical protein
MNRDCRNCTHSELSMDSEPCKSCYPNHWNQSGCITIPRDLQSVIILQLERQLQDAQRNLREQELAVQSATSMHNLAKTRIALLEEQNNRITQELRKAPDNESLRTDPTGHATQANKLGCEYCRHCNLPMKEFPCRECRDGGDSPLNHSQFVLKPGMSWYQLAVSLAQRVATNEVRFRHLLNLLTVERNQETQLRVAAEKTATQFVQRNCSLQDMRTLLRSAISGIIHNYHQQNTYIGGDMCRDLSSALLTDSDTFDRIPPLQEKP